MAYTLSRQISDETLSCAVQIESAGDPNAKAATSSALGLAQFVNATWLACINIHEPLLAKGRTRAQVLALRRDPKISLRMLARLWEDNLSILGPTASDGDLYLAHFLGVVTARALLRSAPATPVSQVCDPQQIKANKSILAGKSCGEVRLWAQNKMARARGKNWVARFMAPVPTYTFDGKAPIAVPADQVQGGEIPLPKPDPREPSLADFDPALEAIQHRLKALGYYEVGLVDGRPGSRTVAAIAAFKSDRALPGEPIVDDALRAAIADAEAQAWTRPISKSRQDLTAKEIAPEIEPVRESIWSRFLAKLGLGAGAGAIGGGSALDYFDTLSHWRETVVQLGTALPWQLWVGGFGLIFLFIWWSQRKAVAGNVRLAQEGRLLP